jgi:uncharacterized pyridoxamine 5'-phosphate oxidase family protein
MERVVKFLADAKVFYVATVEGTLPRVRPFGIAFDVNGKLSIVTSSEKDVFKQITANPNIEISATQTSLDFIRISGKVKQVTTPELQQKLLVDYPQLGQIYKGKENTIEILSFESAVVVFRNFSGKETITL